MHEYDTTLKLLLQRAAPRSLRELTGTDIASWLNVDLPELGDREVDLLGESRDGELIHIELQSANDRAMPLRMAEYCLRIYRQWERFPRQTVLYVGKDKMRMEAELAGPHVSFRYALVDLREIDGERLVASDQVGDNVIAILTRLRSQEAFVRETVEKLAGLEDDSREFHLRALLELASLRDLEGLVATEVRKMPIILNILDNKVLGPAYMRGELAVLRRQIAARFGAVPDWVEERLAQCSAPELEDLGVRLLKAETLEEVMQ